MKRKITVIILAVLCLIFAFSTFALAVDDSQVLIAKDYFDKVIATLATKEYVDSKSQSATSEYVVIGPLSKGQIVVGGASTEMILRTGGASASIPETAGGGLSDLTGGADISNGKAISKNHLLLFPRDDGRALLVTSDNSYIMVKGTYTLQ